MRPKKTMANPRNVLLPTLLGNVADKIFLFLKINYAIILAVINLKRLICLFILYLGIFGHFFEIKLST